MFGVYHVCHEGRLLSAVSTSDGFVIQSDVHVPQHVPESYLYMAFDQK